MLVKTKQSHTGVKCRILIFTDGMDNESVIKSWEITRKLATDKIVLDSIGIGTEWTSHLFKILKITGGYAFAPDTQQAFFQIFLLETLIDIHARPDIGAVPVP